MVMTRHHAPPSARLILLVLLPVTLRLATDAAPAWAKPEDRGTAKGGEEAATAAAEEEEETVLVPPPRGDDGGGGGAANDTSQDGDERPELGLDPARALSVLLQALDWPAEADARQEATSNLLEVNEIRRQSEADKLIQDFEEEARGRRRSAEDLPEKASDGSFLAATPRGDDSSLRRKIRGYFQNIDLGLQDNEILPPLKGYKAYNTQLARAGKKLHWQGNSQAGPIKGGNFMDDFEDEGGEQEEEEVEEEDESLTRMEEEARARAEKQEVLRQQEEAERAREEEQRLADVASDMLLQYMGRKQQAFLKPRQKSSNAAEDKRSEEVLLPDQDQDDLDQQMIDRLIEISSKLHLPADDVIEIIGDVEEKKKKRKELQQQQQQQQQLPAVAALPVVPRFRPLVPPPLAAELPPPVYHYTASKNPKKALYRAPHKASYKSMKKWQKDKGKSRKKDFWYQPRTPIDYWYKPQKQFLAFPSYPYYQKPYRAYYPVYFPYPKPQYYGKPPPARDQAFNAQELDPQSPRRRHRGQGKNRGQGWRQRPAPRLPDAPYISNYILPHPRTYQPPPPPKALAPPRRGRRPPFYYQPAAARDDDYEEDGLLPQLDSEEELENFIERIYMKRRMY